MRALLTLLILFFLAPVAAIRACEVDSNADIALQGYGGTITVPVMVNGVEATFILDTGAERSMVTEDAARRLGLERDPWVATTMSGVGGLVRRPNANPRSLSLGRVPLARRTVKHDTSLTVGVMPFAQAANVVIDGLLGRDFLWLFDLDIDVPGHQLTLYRVEDCQDRFLPWTFGYTAIPASMSIPNGQAIVLPVTLDGRSLRAMLDSGASASILAATGMYRLGVSTVSVAGDPAGHIAGVGDRRLTVHQHRFRSLRIGDDVIEAPLIWVEPIRLQPIVDMLLGADWLARQRVWVSFATRQVFVAAGGSRP